MESVNFRALLPAIFVQSIGATSPFDKESLDWCEKASLFPKMWKIILGQFGTLYTTTMPN